MGFEPTALSFAKRTCTKKSVAKIVNVLWHLKKLGYRDSTLEPMGERLQRIGKHADLDDPESVKEYVAGLDCTEGYKGNLINAYEHYVNYHGLEWEKPHYNRVDRITRIPRETDLDKIISHARTKYALAYKILKDTGLRPIELTWLQVKHIDLETGRLYPGTAKHGKGRVLQIKHSTLAMLKRYIQRNGVSTVERIWTDRERLTENWCRLTNSLAKKLNEPHLKHIKLYDLRHFYATMLYAKTKDIVHVQRQLGHKNINNTLRYLGLVDLDAQEFVVKVGSTVVESTELLEHGYTFIAVIEGKYVFRKPKLPSFFDTTKLI